jgi:diguanylate cyclase (GGDEF)-like protein
MRVLIADDNRDAALTLAVLLRAWGFEPVVVYDGPDALAMLQEPGAPRLALLDWVMPELDGIEICRQLREVSERPYTYIILVTGRGSREQRVDGLRAGADDYLVKPVDVDELQARLSTAKRILDLQEQLLGTQRLLRDQATRDGLTELWNRAMILEILQRELPRSRREGHPLAVIMADIDHFKQINDTHGHLAGDHVLRQTAQRLLAVLRPYDTVGRYGGEEFLVVLPGCGGNVALNLAERLRQSVAAEPIAEGEEGCSVTLSLGVADWDGQMSARELLQCADSALYQAKRAGRNRVARFALPVVGTPG